MGALAQFKIGEGAAGIDFSTVAWQFLSAIAPKWAEVAAQLDAVDFPDKPDGPAALFQLIRDPATTQAVDDALIALGLTDLSDMLGSASAAIAKLPKEFGLLLHRFDSFQEVAPAGEPPEGKRRDGDDRGEVLLPLIKLDEAGSGTTGKLDFSFDVSGNANLLAEAGALWPYGVEDRPGLLCLMAKAGVKASGKASLPFQFGSVTASAKGDVAATCEWYVRPRHPERSFAEALIDAVPRLPSPFDLDAIREASATDRFEGLVIGVTGDAEIGVSVAVSHGADLAEVLAAGAKIGIEVSVRREAIYNFSVLAQGEADGNPRALVVTLSHDRKAEENWAAGLGLSIDPAPLVAKIHKQLVNATKGWSETFKTIEPFLSPGTYIRDMLGDELGQLVDDVIGDDAISDAVTADLMLAIGASDAAGSSVEDLLKSKLTDAIGSVRETLSGKSETAASKAVDHLIDQLPVFARDDARALIEPKIADLLTKVNSKLDGVVKTMFDQDASLLADQLERAGIAVQRMADTLDAALAGVRSFVKKFDAILHDLVEATGESAKTKISAEFAIAVKDERRTSIDMVGTFAAIREDDDDRSAATTLYRAMAMGRMKAVQRLFDPGHKVAGFDLDRKNSMIERYAARTSTTGFTLVLFGLEVSVKEIVKGEAKVIAFADGIAVAASATLSRQTDGFDEGRNFGFVSSYDLLIASVDADRGPPQKSLNLVIGLDHKDDKLERREVERFIGNLATIGLIEPHRSQKALEIFDGWTVLRGGKRKLGGNIAIRVTIDPVGVDQMLTAGRTLRAGKADAIVPFSLAVDALRATNIWERASFRRHIGDLRSALMTTTAPKPADDLELLFLNRERFASDVPAAKEYSEPLLAWLALLEQMANIYDATPGKKDGEWDEQKYKRAEFRLAGYGRKWFRLNSKWIFWFKPGVGQRTTAFLILLACLTRNVASAADLAASQGQATKGMVSITMTPLEKALGQAQMV